MMSLDGILSHLLLENMGCHRPRLSLSSPRQFDSLFSLYIRVCLVAHDYPHFCSSVTWVLWIHLYHSKSCICVYFLSWSPKRLSVRARAWPTGSNISNIFARYSFDLFLCSLPWHLLSKLLRQTLYSAFPSNIVWLGSAEPALYLTCVTFRNKVRWVQTTVI